MLTTIIGFAHFAIGILTKRDKNATAILVGSYQLVALVALKQV